MGQNLTTKPQPDKKNGHKPEPVVLPEPAGEFVGVAELSGGAVGANGDDLQKQAGRLNDARTQTVQRQRIAMQIGQVQGNQHLQYVIQAVNQNGNGHASGHKSNGNGLKPRIIAEEDLGVEFDGLSTGGPLAFAGAGSPENKEDGHGKKPAGARTTVQTKLTVNEPDDKFEQEADQVADTVMRSESAAPQLPPEDGKQKNGKRPISAVQASGSGVPDVASETEHQIHALKGNGSPLPEGERAFFEERIGADFSQVRVHTGNEAVQTAHDLGARAYTTGSDIVFSEGEYQPGTDNGRRLLAHELTHVVQQGAAASAVQRQPVPSLFRQTAGQHPNISTTSQDIQRLPDIVAGELNDYARHIPGYTLFTVIIGFNPLTGADVPRNATNLLEGLMGLVPFGTLIFDALQEHGIIQSVFEWVEDQLSRLNLSISSIEQTIEAAWDEMELIEGFDFNLAILERHFARLYDSVVSFATSLVDHIIELIKEAAISLAEELLADNQAWALIKKILHYDPLRGEPVEATTVEILEDFLRLIGKETELEQMREKGTLQETADWLDTQVGNFMSLLGELRGLFETAWNAIQPQNLPDLVSNLQGLARQVGGFLQRVWDFASSVAIKVLELIKNALLSWLSEFAHEIPGFHLITVILGINPFTQEIVPRTAENIIKGFITLLPGGEEKYNQLAETGTIGNAAQRIEGAMEELGINWGMITGLFQGIWDGLSIDDLVDPIGAFQRIVDQFGEPISRLFSFIQVVVKEIFSLILELMNFPSDIVSRIIDNAMRAYEDIKNDPVAFFNHMLEAVKIGFTHFFDNILQHLLSGVSNWLFGQLEAAGITPPTDLSLESILGLVLQVLGISMDQIWQKLGERIGPENVARIRGAIDRLTGIWTFIRDVQERGIVAIWEYIQSQISNLWDMILEKARDWIVTEIIERVVTKLLSMLDPTGIMAVVNSFIAFFNAIQSAIEYFREILMIVDDYVSTIASVAQGNVEPGAEKMEGGLASSIPVAIGFLANQVGLGNIAEKISEIIGGIREVVDQALDWLIDRAVSMGQSLLSSLGFGSEDEDAEEGEGGTPAEEEAVTTDVESIPEGLPPVEVKQRVLDMVQSQLIATDANSIQAVHGILQSIMDANRDRGLHGLSMRVDDQSSMSVRIEASASEPMGRRIAWSDIFAPSTLNPSTEIDNLRENLSEASQASYAAIVVDGHQIGSMSESGGGTHAEEGLVRGPSWSQAINIARQGVQQNKSSRVTLMINRTPCASCVQWLKEAIESAKSTLGLEANNVIFLLAATGTYRRQARMSEEDKAALKAGSERMAKRLGRPFDEVFAEQEEIWKEDLRSFSTEWVDDDEVQYSGLSDLANAGWQITGIDFGEPPTARQIELAQISAQMAEEFEWDS